METASDLEMSSLRRESIRQLEFLASFQETARFCRDVEPLMHQIATLYAEKQAVLLPEVRQTMELFLPSMLRVLPDMIEFSAALLEQYLREGTEGGVSAKTRRCAKNLLEILRRGDAETIEEALHIWEQEPHYYYKLK